MVAAAACIALAAQARAGGGALTGFVDSFGYGYAVSVSVNGTPIASIRGDGQQAVRLFGLEHPLRAQSTPETAGLFVLREGENSISVEFRRTGDAASALQVKLEVPDRYDAPLFHLTSEKRLAGKAERTVVIDREVPPAFATVVVTDDDLGTPPGR